MLSFAFYVFVELTYVVVKTILFLKFSTSRIYDRQTR